MLRLGTEIVSAGDRSIAALLGASPCASTAAPIMLSLLEKVFADKVATPAWQDKIRQIVPSYGTQLNSDPQRVDQEWTATAEQLQLPTPPQIDLAALSNAARDSDAADGDSAPAQRVHDLAP